MIIKEAKTKEEILQAIFLRRKTLIDERKYSVIEEEPDEYDLISKVYVVKEGDKVIGTARVKKEGIIYRIQRMAIDNKERGKGIGSKLIKRILQDFKNKKIYLMSAECTIPFYNKFGFNKTKITQKGKYHIYYRLQNY
jgi:predicted GNAT family N-acyltransferase